MIKPLVHFDLESFEQDLKDRIARSKRGVVEIVNQTAQDVAFKSLKACPFANVDVEYLDGEERLRHVTFKTRKAVTFKSSMMRDIIVGAYYWKHRESVKGLNFEGIPMAIDRKRKAKRRGRNFLKSRFVNSIRDFARITKKSSNVGAAGKNLNDQFSYGTPAVNALMEKSSAIIFAAHEYSTKDGIKKITTKGISALDSAGRAGLLAVQNGWRAYANRKLQAALNKTN